MLLRRAKSATEPNFILMAALTASGCRTYIAMSMPSGDSTNGEPISTKREIQARYVELFAANVRRAASRLNLNANSLGARIGIPSSSAANYWKGQRPWPTEVLAPLADELGTTVDALFGRAEIGGALKGEIQRALRANEAANRAEDVASELGLMKLPEIDIAVGMGAGYSDEPVIESVDRWIPAEWVRQFTDAPAERLAIIRPRGDSMYPTINDRDIVFIDRGDRRIEEQDLIWTLVYGGLRTIRRVRALPDGSYLLLADNKSVPDQTANDDEMFVIGRVAGVIRRL